jgi:hypothetical protein
MAAALLVAGCKKHWPTDDTRSNQGGGGGGGNVAAHVVRGRDLQKVRNDLGQLAKLYQVYVTEFGRPPAKWEDFKTYIQRDAPKLVQDIEEGKYVVRWGAPASPGTLLAYEKQVDLRDNQVVVMGDGSVSSMSSQQLQAALQSPGR